MIRSMTVDHLNRYGEIYAAAFSGPPWGVMLSRGKIKSSKKGKKLVI